MLKKGLKMTMIKNVCMGIGAILMLTACGSEDSSSDSKSDNVQNSSSNGTSFKASPFLKKLGNNGVELSASASSWDIVEIEETGLMIEAKTLVNYSYVYNHAEAVIYCENLDRAGFTDWRLPNENELRGLLAVSNNSEIERVYFPHFYKNPVSLWGADFVKRVDANVNSNGEVVAKEYDEYIIGAFYQNNIQFNIQVKGIPEKLGSKVMCVRTQ